MPTDDAEELPAVIRQRPGLEAPADRTAAVLAASSHSRGGAARLERPGGPDPLDATQRLRRHADDLAAAVGSLALGHPAARADRLRRDRLLPVGTAVDRHPDRDLLRRAADRAARLLARGDLGARQAERPRPEGPAGDGPAHRQRHRPLLLREVRVDDRDRRLRAAPAGRHRGRATRALQPDDAVARVGVAARRRARESLRLRVRPRQLGRGASGGRPAKAGADGQRERRDRTAGQELGCGHRRPRRQEREGGGDANRAMTRSAAARSRRTRRSRSRAHTRSAPGSGRGSSR